MKIFACFLTVAVLYLLPHPLLADDEPSTANRPDFSSQAAKSAVQKYERIVSSAEAEYAKRIAEAKARLSAELDVAMKEAMRKTDLDEANRIKAYTEAVLDSTEVGGKRGKLSLKDIVNRPLVVFEVKPGLATFTLLPDSTIKGAVGANEAKWRVSKDGYLQFTTSDGRTTSEYRYHLTDGQNHVFWGPFSGGTKTEVLGLMFIDQLQKR